MGSQLGTLFADFWPLPPFVAFQADKYYTITITTSTTLEYCVLATTITIATTISKKRNNNSTEEPRHTTSPPHTTSYIYTYMVDGGIPQYMTKES